MKTLTIISVCLCVLSSCFNESVQKEEPIGVCGNSELIKNSVAQLDLFKANCATCHMFDRDVTGPKMKDILNRVPSEKWLRAFITNQDSLIQIEDEYTLKIMEWSPIDWRHDFDHLQGKDLDTLMSYITQ